MSDVTQSDELLVELQERDHNPAAVLIRWREDPSMVDPPQIHSHGGTAASIPRYGGREPAQIKARPI